MSREAPLDLLKRAVVACTRTIANDRKLEIVFSKRSPALADNCVHLPALLSPLTAATVPVIRGESDAMALRHAYHDEALHRRLAPQGQQARAIFDALEQARVEAIGARCMLGVSDNLTAMLQDRLDRSYLGTVRDQRDAPLDEAVSLIVRERLTGLGPPKSGELTVAYWRDSIEKQGAEVLDALPSCVDDQNAFASVVLQFLKRIMIASHPLQTDRGGDGDACTKDDGGHATNGTTEDGNDTLGKAEKTDTNDEAVIAGKVGDVDVLTQRSPHAAKLSQFSRDHAMSQIGYRVFTSQYDEIVDARNLCDQQELDRLRAILDTRLVSTQRAVGRLAHRLQRRLMAWQVRSWDFDQEEGILDAARLTRLVIDPMQPLAFKQERDSHFRDTVVTLLIDNSGSMHGRPIATAAICADILSRTLERCGVRVEILGFTTRAWKGGQAREAWLKGGRPANPGRLNDVRHIIYKSADQPWRRARRHLGLMMSEDLLKENIDGEALSWAHQRLILRPERRKILMMISDGAPADDATLLVNPAHYLEHHLRAVIGMIQTRSSVELLAIGIGHDVTRYYDRAVTISDADELASAMVNQLALLFDQESRHRRLLGR